MKRADELLMGVPEDIYATTWGKGAVEEIKRLSAEVEALHAELDETHARFVKTKNELAALRIAEAQPVAWQGVEDTTDLYWRKPVQADVKPLYLHPAVAAKDAERWRQLKHMVELGCHAIWYFDTDRDGWFKTDLNAIDAAMKA